MNAKETIKYLYENGRIMQREHYETLVNELSKPVTEHPDVQRLISKMVILQTKYDKLVEALIIYGNHSRTDDTTMCECMKHSDYPCTCGFEQVMKGIRKMKRVYFNCTNCDNECRISIRDDTTDMPVDCPINPNDDTTVTTALWELDEALTEAKKLT